MMIRFRGTEPLQALCLVICLILPAALHGQQTLTASPVDLLRQTVQNEIDASSNHKFSFRQREENEHGSQTKLIVETTEVAAGMLVAVNDRPLTPEERKNEQARLDNLINNPQELKRKQKADRADTERTNRIMKALKDAFLYEPDGTQAGTAEIGNPGDELVRLKFRPNPNYDPPTHTEQVLTGMSGTMLIDRNKRRLAKIDGTLEKEVGFGWGIL